MKNTITLLSLLLFLSHPVLAQAPSWSVNENEFEHTMTFVSFLNVNQSQLSDTNDKVAAFVGDECRGVANLTYSSSNDRYYAYLTVFANNNGEQVTFKIYDAASDQVYEVENTMPFEINAHYGNLFQAFSIANPTLNSEAEILDFSFEGITSVNSTINQNEVIITLYDYNDISDLTPVFTLSEGAQLFIDTQEYQSGNSQLDFSAPIHFKVRSQDESNLKEWSVKVELIEDEILNGTATFYRKNAVCHTGGSIKVLFTVNDAPVVLYKDDFELRTATIVSGETIFDDLEQGMYKVKIGSYNKEIEISLR